MAFEVISFFFLRPDGLLIYLGVTNAFLLPLIFIFRINIMGPDFPLYHEMTGFFTYDMIGLLLYIMSRLIQRRITDIDKTRYTFETIMKTTPNHMVIINEKAGVEYISDSLAAWLGITHHQYARNRPLLDLFRSGEMKMILQEIMEQGGYVAKNFEITSGGKKHWFMLRSPLLERNKFSRLFEWMDISPIMEAKNEAESAARAKSDFLANISHELRTPMNAIIGMTDLMLSGTLEPEQVSRADTIKGGAMILLNIINDILDFSKIDARKMEINPHTFYFASFISDVVNMTNLKTSAAGLALTTAIDKNIPPLINGDELRLKQCLINILENAVKFTSKGFIHLASWPEFLKDGSLRLNFSVSDTGRGIKKEELGRLFNGFEQFNSHKDMEISGAGLGLAITRRLAELMGGGVTVESVYGEGSTFSFYAICGKPPEPDWDHRGKFAAADRPDAIRALCFEPHPCNARALGDMFESLGVSRKVCVEINEALSLLDTGNFTHVFFDISGKERLLEFFGRQGMHFVLIKEVSEKYDSLIPDTLNRPVLITRLADILNGKRDYQKRIIENEHGTAGFFMTWDVLVLVVDDNPVNLAVAEGLLVRYGITVDLASSGEQAIERIKQAEYDIIFMDHMMPGMDGLDTTRAIRAMGGDFARHIIIALTANAVSGVRDQFLDAGMNGFLAKPVIIGELREILLEHLPQEKIVT
jgi:signal transduction histidine kinase/ActR/RegA family two-component response regulator